MFYSSLEKLELLENLFQKIFFFKYDRSNKAESTVLTCIKEKGTTTAPTNMSAAASEAKILIHFKVFFNLKVLFSFWATNGPRMTKPNDATFRH